MGSVISFENVSKKYRIGRSRYHSLREDISSMFKKPFYRKRQDDANFIWALKDVGFEVKQGESLGIIGPNGAGKTTILKLLSNITLPTTGKISVTGRTAALIELGAGFHPELTGRENVYLYGSIMGMRKEEINKKFDRIVNFAELERFIDTPVKRYSSGMLVRLGFAIVAHTKPDILLIDEVLAVGDLSFQRKCFEYISQLASYKTTMLLVSHNLHMLQRMCKKVIWINQGYLKEYGETSEVINHYSLHESKGTVFEPRLNDYPVSERWGTREAKILTVKVMGKKNNENVFETGDNIQVYLEYNALKRIEHPVFWIAITAVDGKKICGTIAERKNCDCGNREYYIEGKGAVKCTFKNIPFLPGRYFFVVGIYGRDLTIAYDRWGKAVEFTIKESDREDIGGSFNSEYFGTIYVETLWTFNKER